MQRKDNIWQVARKELTLFFASPVAYLFLGIFAAVTLFIFFWGESFFSRNISDVRPLFEWMPILLIFLCASVTMRMWSEERRSGTLEFVLTMPVDSWRFVLGKFLACLILLAIAIALTLSLPITVTILTDFNLDWGPVIAGYLATMLLGAAYISIGLFVSARSDNQIVSLMLTTLICSIFYLLGASVLTNLVGNTGHELLSSLSTGSRFESITRGVIDFRDLYYYLSIIAIFLVINVYSLERIRWANDGNKAHHGLWRVATILLTVNIAVANLWIGYLYSLRVDITQGNIYSISDATNRYLSQLQEPLIIRGYFSDKTHPALAPLVPQIRDLLREYEIAGKGNVRSEFIDPTDDQDLEEEADQKYGIKPTPFQVSDRYQAAVVNSYFNILVLYGDEFAKLGFEELIEVKQQTTGFEVALRNPEYDITRSIRKVLYAYQSGGNIFDSISEPVQFTGYFSPDNKLPGGLVEFKKATMELLEDYKEKGGEKFSVKTSDPQEGDGKLAQFLAEQYGFRPMAASLFDNTTFYYYMMLETESLNVQIPLPPELDQDALRRAVDTGLKRFASGMAKTVALVVPPATQAGPNTPQTNQFQTLKQVLSQDMNVRDTDLKDGAVPEDADILVVASPMGLDDTQVFAMDQFLMQGGTVILSAAPYNVTFGRGGITGGSHETGLKDWLDHHGVYLSKEFVMDPQSMALPVPVQRRVGSFTMQEIVMTDYPYMIDLRASGINDEHPVTGDLSQLTMSWATKMEVDEDENSLRKVDKLLESSELSWLSSATHVTPMPDDSGNFGFKPTEPRGSHLLGAAIQGRFDSFFKGKESPLLAAADETPAEGEEPKSIVTGIIEHSPESARLIVFPSNQFASDQVLRLSAPMGSGVQMNPLQVFANAIDWATDDSGLLSIRSRSHFNRTLPPMEEQTQKIWEYVNYVLALAVLIILIVFQRQRRSAKNKRQLIAYGLREESA